MDIKSIIEKACKGEELTDAEKEFAKTYDHEKVTNDAAAAARRKAEGERDAAKKALEKANADLDAIKAKADADSESKKTDMEKLTSNVEALTGKLDAMTKKAQAAEAQAAAVNRSQSIRDAAKAAGIALAPKTVNEGLFYQLLETTLADVDIADKAALTAALETFKTENAGVIVAPGNGSGVDTGNPSKTFSGKNPWAKESFNVTEQVMLFQSDPGKARAMAAEHGVTLD